MINFSGIGNLPDETTEPERENSIDANRIPGKTDDRDLLRAYNAKWE